MFDFLIAPFTEFAFMRRALAGCLALALGATPVGVFLLLRRMSLMGDAMSHAILPGAALGYLAFGLSLGAMTVTGIVAGLVVVFAAGLVTRASVLKEDASLAAFYLLSLARHHELAPDRLRARRRWLTCSKCLSAPTSETPQ